MKDILRRKCSTGAWAKRSYK